MRSRFRSGFTLIETLISLALLGIVLGALYGVIMGVQRDYVRQARAVRAQETLRSVELLVTRLLRSARVDPMRVNVASLDPDPAANGVFDDIRIRSDFNPADGDVLDPLEDVLVNVRNDTLFVRWQAGQASEPAAYPVQSMQFEYFTTNGTLLATTALASTARRVKLTTTVPKYPGSSDYTRRETWTYLRN
jgi:prepilin-type N-terminal cleavage/methylation domain-containing protein